LIFLWDRPEKDEKTDKKIPENGYLCPVVLYEYRDRLSGGFANSRIGGKNVCLYQ
jgi:hypothetical protein